MLLSLAQSPQEAVCLDHELLGAPVSSVVFQDTHAHEQLIECLWLSTPVIGLAATFETLNTVNTINCHQDTADQHCLSCLCLVNSFM